MIVFSICTPLPTHPMEQVSKIAALLTMTIPAGFIETSWHRLRVASCRRQESYYRDREPPARAVEGSTVGTMWILDIAAKDRSARSWKRHRKRTRRKMSPVRLPPTGSCGRQRKWQTSENAPFAMSAVVSRASHASRSGVPVHCRFPKTSWHGPIWCPGQWAMRSRPKAIRLSILAHGEEARARPKKTVLNVRFQSRPLQARRRRHRGKRRFLPHNVPRRDPA